MAALCDTVKGACGRGGRPRGGPIAAFWSRSAPRRFLPADRAGRTSTGWSFQGLSDNSLPEQGAEDIRTIARLRCHEG